MPDPNPRFPRGIRDSVRDVTDHVRPIVNLNRDTVDGVFEGGGALGTAYVGALMALQEHRIWFKRVAGTSAGAITAAMIAAGYSASEIAWLTAPSDLAGQPPASLPLAARNMAPIAFTTFVDPPRGASDINAAVRRSTVLWNMLNLTAIQQLREYEINIKTRTELVQEMTDGIVAINPAFNLFRGAIQSVVGLALAFYPNEDPVVGDFLPLPPEPLRQQFADRAWNAFADLDDTYPTLVNILYNGGVARGDVFHDTIRGLISAKVTGGVDADVPLKDLPLPLAVIGADTTASRMIVYSSTSAATREVSVADAVRASMSIPFMFEPHRSDDGHDIMDGGILSNYPFWLFTGEGDGYVTETAEDMARTKLGFLLDDSSNTPRGWDAPAPKWTTRGGAGREPDIWDALEPTLGPEITNAGQGANTELIILGRMLRMYRTMDQKESLLSQPLRRKAQETLPFHEINIPVKGFSWLDFSVNEDAGTFSSMAFRGWESVVRTDYFRSTLNGSAPEPNPFGDN
jgi:predicted acylesterase/phospholipase RssA